MKRLTPWQRAYRTLWLQEQRFLRQYAADKESPLDRKLRELAPDKALEALHAAFEKAFATVFEKGEGLIGRTTRREERQAAFQVRQYALDLREDRKNLGAVAKAARAAGRGSAAISAAAGVGMGLLGVGLPDVPLFTALLLRSVYEIGESCGFSHESDPERRFILCLIEAALSSGQALEEKNRALDRWIQTGQWTDPLPMRGQIQAAARRLSGTMLCGKLLQGVPLVGAVGGAEDMVCLNRVRRYAALKYRRRFLLERAAR